MNKLTAKALREKAPLNKIILALLALGLSGGCLAAGESATATTTAATATSATPAESLAVAPISDADISALFADFCLTAFPSAAALDTLAQTRSATVMTDLQVRSYLHNDPGHGWYLQTPQGLYAITIEDPPFHACAVRRMTPSGTSSLEHYSAAVKTYVEGGKYKLSGLVRRHDKTDGGADIYLFGNQVLDANGKPTAEAFMVIFTDYHGHPLDPWRADAGGGTGVEVRLVRQIRAPE